MILEGIVTTINPDQTVNVAPMGPVVNDHQFDRFVLRPYQTSTTYRNLKLSGEGVLHVTDDVELFVDAAIHSNNQTPECHPAIEVSGAILKDCCRYFEFRAESIDDQQPRTGIVCRVVSTKELRPFWGFNRAKHAVLEMAILATRIEILDKSDILQHLLLLQPAIEKTAGSQELSAFRKLKVFFRDHGLEFSHS